MGVGERTPLLLRATNNSNNNIRPQQRIIVDDELDTFFNKYNNDETFIKQQQQLNNDKYYHNAKNDRRGICTRIGSCLVYYIFRKRRNNLNNTKNYNQQPTSKNNNTTIDDGEEDSSLQTNNDQTTTTTTTTSSINNHGYDENINNKISCTFGTNHNNGIWYNIYDVVGCIMAISIWFITAYCISTVLVLTAHNHYNIICSYIFITCSILALASHVKTTLTDPGSIPYNAIPIINNNNTNNNIQQSQQLHSICSICQSYKPNGAHHCRICNRCISRMDHHCPWMNNCVGANNTKHFILFLLYTWIACIITLIQLLYSRFCTNCNKPKGLELNFSFILGFICLCTVLFVSSMILNVINGIRTGVGTIDRLKKKAVGEWNTTTKISIPLSDIFGTNNNILSWCIPIDPNWGHYDKKRIFGYTYSKKNHTIQWQTIPTTTGGSNNNSIAQRIQEQQQQRIRFDASWEQQRMEMRRELWDRKTEPLDI